MIGESKANIARTAVNWPTAPHMKPNTIAFGEYA